MTISEAQLDTPSMTQSSFEKHLEGIVKDLFLSDDYEEAASSITALKSASLHDLMMQKVICAALAKGPTHFPIVTNLAKHMINKEDLTETQLMRALHSFASSMSEMLIDYPKASEYLYSIIEQLVDANVIDQAEICQFPEIILRAGNVEPHLSNLRIYKKKTKPIIESYFHTADYQALDEAVKRIGHNEFHHEFLKQAFKISFDRNRRERAMLIHMIDEAHENALIDQNTIQLGFASLLGYLDDGVLDCPEINQFAIDILSSAVVNELVSADLLHRYLRLGFGGVSGKTVLEKTLRQTPEHSRKVWGSGDITHLWQEMENTITEYFDSRDMQEVGQILGELHLSRNYDLMFLRMLFTKAMIYNKQDIAIQLVKYLYGVHWHTQDIADVIEKLRTDTDDLVLDIPNLHECTTELVDDLITADLLDDWFPHHDRLTIV